MGYSLGRETAPELDVRDVHESPLDEAGYADEGGEPVVDCCGCCVAV